MPYYSDELIEEIRSANDIVDVILNFCPRIPVYIVKHKVPQSLHRLLYLLRHADLIFFYTVGDNIVNHGIQTLSVRIVEKLEKDGQGLNLTWEVRDGILNHQTSLMPATLEGKIVRLSDKIAYINHDIDDAIRARVLSEEDIPAEYRNILGTTTRPPPPDPHSAAELWLWCGRSARLPAYV